MITDEITGNDWDDAEDLQRSEEHDEACNAFWRFLAQKRRDTQARVRMLYPRLYAGVCAYEIQNTVEDALYWLNVPDDWAHEYADEFVENGFGFNGMYEVGIELWVETEVSLLRDLGKWLPDDTPGFGVDKS